MAKKYDDDDDNVNDISRVLALFTLRATPTLAMIDWLTTHQYEYADAPSNANSSCKLYDILQQQTYFSLFATAQRKSIRTNRTKKDHFNIFWGKVT